jgi:UDP-N-acetylmuramoyl-tripeptide--D-alanyl-D-alanine ligase
MAELGPDAPAFHARIGQAAAGNADVLVAVGELAHGYLGGGVEVERHVATVDDALGALEELVRPGDVVLVKASRSAGLERIAEALTAVKV